MTYTEYRAQRQNEFNSLPIFYAFSDAQFNEAMKERGYRKKDIKDIRAIGAGGYCHKDDIPKLQEFCLQDRLLELMKDPAFAEDAFYEEMGNHEYHINMQADWDVCSCFGNVKYEQDYTKELQSYFEQLGFSKETRAAYIRARKRYMQVAEENGWY